MTRAPDEVNRLVRMARWAAVAITGLLCLITGPRLSTRDLALVTALVSVMAAINLVEARGVATRRDWALARRWHGFVLLLEMGIAVTFTAIFQTDQRFGVWAGLILPVLHGAAIFGTRGATALWVPSTALLAAVDLHTGAGTAPVAYQSAMLLLLAWAFGRLCRQLTEQGSSVRDLQRMTRTAQQIVSLDAEQAVELATRTAHDLGVDELNVVWRVLPSPTWQTASPFEGLQEWADGVVHNLGEHRGIARLLDRDGAELSLDPHAATGTLVMAGRVEGSVTVLLTARPWRRIVTRDVELLEVLLHHTAERLISVGLQIRASQREQHLSEHDLLTKLPNRARVTHEIDRAIKAQSTSGGSSAVLLFDLDRFKEINDTLGHEHGDRLLVEVADRMRDVLREGDVLARLGGDEFAVLVDSTRDPDQAVRAAERLRKEVNRPLSVGGVTLNVESSVGIALSPTHGTTAYDLLRCADIAMYEAKRNQRGIALYDPTADRHTPERLTLLADLREALAGTDQLTLHYQPMIGLSTGRVVAAEALLRWNHPRRGLVMPGDFIPLAESTGLIHAMTLHVLDQASAQLAAWQRQGLDLSMAVNISARSLLDPELPAIVMDTLQRHGADPRRMRLEITESTIMEDPVRAVETLARLNGHGVKLSIDDFGTGYSSLAYLKQLPVDELKVDRSFVMDLLEDEDDAVLVRAVVDLGHNLGLHVVAEGVEDAETLTRLGGLGCDVAQGFHLSRPIPASQITGWIETWNSALPRQRGQNLTVSGE